MVFRIKPEPPQAEWTPKRMVLKIQSRQDLWRVCMRSSYSTVIIPELEFEFSADGKRHCDNIYNHVASAGAATCRRLAVPVNPLECR